VFDELDRLEPAAYGTTAVTVTAPSAADAAALLEAVGAAGLHAEDWTGSIRPLCAACGDGEVHHHTPVAGWQPQRSVGIAGEPERVAGVLDGWAAAGPGRSWRL
jgi:hypothetical protein